MAGTRETSWAKGCSSSSYLPQAQDLQVHNAALWQQHPVALGKGEKVKPDVPQRLDDVGMGHQGPQGHARVCRARQVPPHLPKPQQVHKDLRASRWVHMVRTEWVCAGIHGGRSCVCECGQW